MVTAAEKLAEVSKAIRSRTSSAGSRTKDAYMSMPQDSSEPKSPTIRPFSRPTNVDVPESTTFLGDLDSETQIEHQITANSIAIADQKIDV